ncbi:hypothetical protein [Azotobacter chroococcum]|uniref:hypothetical protein n=1 Tax=Azotobacter chroococcum TaxID=353 RepID=UPI000B5E8C45|nr:hypothetical protein [Azotobacter chroococcum]ASL27365.1 hypothetical protein ACG10_14565 [Azotobacter chroococcum]
MAVYGVEKGELVLLAETLESMLCQELANWKEFDDLLKDLGLWVHDEVGDAYKLYRRQAHAESWPEGRLPGVKFIFDVNVDGDSIDYILVGDRLPDFLAVLRLLEPLVAADRDVAARAEKMRQEDLRRLGRG